MLEIFLVRNKWCDCKTLDERQDNHERAASASASTSHSTLMPYHGHIHR